MLRDDEPPCLQLQVHEQNLVFEQGLPKNVSNYIIIDRQSVCLNEILRPDLMSPRKRLYVSHLLIQAFWQCYGSKWMDDAWTKLRIHFMYTLNTSRNSEPQLFAHEPFLTIDFAEHEQRALSINALIPSKVRALGIMLLELELGTTIESHWLAAFLNAEGKPNAFTDLSTAQSLVPEKPEEDKELRKRETYAVLREIIRKCLYATEFKNGQNGDHERDLIFREILTPIQNALTIIGGDCEEIRFQPLRLGSSAGSRQTTEKPTVTTVASSSFAVPIVSNYHSERRGQARAKLFDCLHACTEEE
jgi:hypothetical protein